MIESAYAKLCIGDTEEALFMFREVRDVAVANKDDFLSQVSGTNHNESIVRKAATESGVGGNSQSTTQNRVLLARDMRHIFTGCLSKF